MTSLIAVILLLIAMPASADDAPSMWMVQDGSNLDLMVNTSEVSFGANAWIHFDPACVNITDVNVTGSPWQPLEGAGWSHQGDHVIIALTNFDGVAPGEYRIAKLAIDCIDENCTSAIEITKAEPIGAVVTNTTFMYTTETIATISIADGRGSATLPIMITDVVDVGAVDITLSYDPAIVTVTNVTAGAMDANVVNLEHIDEGWVRIGAYQITNPGMTGQFALASITFEPNGTGSCPLELNVTTFKDATPASTSITHGIIDGVYINPRHGDADGDSDLDLCDAMYIAKHVIGISGFEYLDEDAADVNGDGIVDMADAMYLAMHVLGVPGFEDLK